MRRWRLSGRALGIGTIGPQDNFFEPGGDSMAAIQALAEMEWYFGITFPLAHLHRAPTVAQMARDWSRFRNDAQSSSLLVTLQPAGSHSPFFGVHGVGGSAVSFTASLTTSGRTTVHCHSRPRRRHRSSADWHH
jgi:hypothetical protein